MTSQPTLFDRLPARVSDPVTSKAQPAKKAVASQAAVLAVLRRFGAQHDKEIVLRVQNASPSDQRPWSPSRIRSARAELVKLGRVRNTGRTEIVDGSKCIVWGLA